MPAAEAALGFLRANGRSLENILENEEAGKSNCPEPPAPSRYGQASDGPRGLEVAATATNNPLSVRPEAAAERDEQAQPSRSYTGAIPKRSSSEASNLLVSSASAGSNSRLTVNPIAEAVKRLPSSRSTYFCLKSILKQNRRRFTLVTPEELQSLTRTGEPGPASAGPEADSGDDCACQGCRTELTRPTSLRIDKRHRPLSCHSLNYRRENSRTLIFASPIQEVCPLDPFAGQNRVTSEQPPRYDEATATAATTASTSTPVLTRLRRSLTDRADGACASAAKTSRAWRHRRTRSTEPELAQLGTLGSSDATWTGLNGGSGSNEVAISLPSYDGLTVPPDSRAAQEQSDEERRAFLGDDELAATIAAASTSQAEATGSSEVRAGSRLRRSLTERRSAPESRRQDRNVRKSFTERIDTGVRIKRANINIETSL